jgi:hypothetical protein
MALTSTRPRSPLHEVTAAGPRRPVDPLELLLLVVFAVMSMWVVALNLWLAANHGLVWTGIDGEFPVDQMQYLAWVQDASHHVLASDLFGFRTSPHDYLEPMLAISGGLSAAGVAPWLALLLWKPVAVVAAFFAVRAYCRRALPSRWEQLAAIALGLFAAFWGTLGDVWVPFLSWGYPFGLIAVAAMLGALVSYERARNPWLPAALGLIASWLHPWQGELLILVILGGELLLRRRSRRPLVLPAVTIGATALPLVYYGLLDRADSVWNLAETITRHHPWSLSGAVLPLLPLIVVALPAYLRPPRNFIGLTARIWPGASLIVWFLTQAGLGATPLHAWTAISVPLGVLAVEGVQVLGFRRLPARGLIGALAVAVMTVPGSYLQMKPTEAYIAPSTGNQNLITHSEQRAFQYLANDPQPGGVLSSYTLGDSVPAETDRHTYAGDYRWSGPDYETHETLAWDLLHGRLSGAAGRTFVLGSGARFVLADCGERVDLRRTLAPLPLTVHRFGCATVYTIG